MDSETVIDVFIDEGSAGVKIIWVEDGELKRDLLASRVVQEHTPTSDGSFSDGAYEADGDDYTVAPFMDGTMPTDTRSYQVSAYNRVLVHEALRKNGFGGKKVSITTTLPVGDFYAVKPRNQILIDEKKENLQKPVKSMANNQLSEIVEVKVSSEAIPAWMNYLLDDDGNIVIGVDESSRILVVDSGGTTTDMAILDGFGNIQRQTSVRVGGFAVGDNLRPLLISRFKRKKIENHQIDVSFKNGKFAGECIAKEIEKACKPVETRILTEMEKFQPDAEDLDAVLYVGGLSALTASRLASSYGGVSIVGDEFSIVQGIRKQALANKKQEEEQHAED